MLYRKYIRKYMRALKSTTLLFLIAVFCVSNFVAILIPHQRVFAQSADNMSPQEQIKHIQAANFFGHCIQSSGLIKYVSFNDLNNYAVIGADAIKLDVESDVGFVADPSDGRWRCLSDQAQVKNALGMTGKELFIDSGIYGPKNDNTGYEVIEGNNGNAANKLVAAAAKKYPTINFYGTMPKGLQYFGLYATFKAQCNGGEDPVGGVPIKELDDNGEIIQPTKKYSLRDNNAWPVGFNMDSPDGEDMKCRDIASRLNSDEYVNEASKIQKEYIAKGGKPGEGGGAAAPSCESNNGKLIIGWLVCGFIGILDDVIDKSTEIVEGLLYFDTQTIDPDTSNPECVSDNCKQAKKNLKAAWSVFRVLSSVSLLAVALIMIIGQAAGGE